MGVPTGECVVKTIPLSRGYVALVDDGDYDRLITLGTWYAVAGHNTFYGRRNLYHREDGSYTYLLMHNVITGWPMTDHRNGNGLDNQRVNLRPATRSQNMANRRLNSNSASGFKGVHRQRNRWIAHCKSIYLGSFTTAEEAARAYDAAARELFGEFARLNFPEGTAA